MSNTPGDPTQDDTVLASAYLDGEVTPDERALVEASDDVLAEVERLRRVRAVVAADVQPAAVSTRESQLAAALDVFDQLGAGAPAASAVAPMSAGRARRARRTRAGGGDRARIVLGVAAGLVIVAGAGAVIRGVIVSTDETDDVAEAPADEPAEESGIGPSEDDIMAELEGDNTNDDPSLDFDPGEVAADVTREEAAEELSGGFAEDAEAPTDEAFADAPTAAAEAEPDDAGVEQAVDDADELPAAEDPPPDADIVELLTEEDLADFAAPAAYAPDSVGVDDALTFSPCDAERPGGLGIDRLAEPALVGGEVFDVGIDLDEGRAYVFRDDCSVVLAATLPTEEEFLAANPIAPPTTEQP